MQVIVKAEIEIPNRPNFLRMSSGQTISIADIKDEGLKEIGERWTEELLNRAAQIRESRKNDV